MSTKGLPKENEQSYYYFMHDNLFSHVNIDPANTHLPDGTESLTVRKLVRNTIK